MQTYQQLEENIFLEERKIIPEALYWSWGVISFH